MFVVHAELRKDGVVGGPSVGSARGVHLVVLQVDVLRVVRVAKGNLCGATHVARHHAAAHEIHHVHDGRHGERFALVRLERSASAFVQLAQRTRPGGDAAEAADGRSCRAYERIVKGHGLCAMHVALDDEPEALDPALSRVGDLVRTWRGRCTRASHVHQARAQGVKAHAHAKHGRFHEEGKGRGAVLVELVRAHKGAVVERGKKAALLSNGCAHGPETPPRGQELHLEYALVHVPRLRVGEVAVPAELVALEPLLLHVEGPVHHPPYCLMPMLTAAIWSRTRIGALIHELAQAIEAKGRRARGELGDKICGELEGLIPGRRGLRERGEGARPGEP
mmetsp:Transcript_30117/g.80886  ORF Transcript_30117/g.80886 Transcript_30117/m.80886 type:complete len:336 (+) Transcript_30117:551-1558(+)